MAILAIAQPPKTFIPVWLIWFRFWLKVERVSWDLALVEKIIRNKSRIFFMDFIGIKEALVKTKIGLFKQATGSF